MRRMIWRLAAMAILPLAALGCDNKGSDQATTGAVAEANTTTTAEAPPSAAPTAAETAAAAPTGTAEAAPSGTAAAAPADTAAAATTAAAAAPTATAAAATTAAAAAGEKTYDCGAKGQKACPMQGWMKGAMASAASSGDGEKLAKALSYAAGKPPPGFGNWSSIASAGAAKAKEGDIDGAKASCKQCHDAYKERYKKTMRDAPW